MHTPGHIALVGASAIALAMVAASVSLAVFHPGGAGSSLGNAVLSAVIEASTIGAFVWCGTYLGARIAPPRQRDNRLSLWLAVIYFVAGIALSMPIKTHAVLVDMPVPSEQGPQAHGVGSITLSLIPLIFALLLPMALTRILAIMLTRRTRRDA